MKHPVRLSLLPLSLLLLGACGDGGTDPDDETFTIQCSASDPVCPVGSTRLGFSGVAGSPTITPSNATTTVTTSSSSQTVAGTTSATSNGNWLIVVENTLRASGVLPVSGGSFAAEIPLFCGAQQVVYTFETNGNRSYYRTNVTQTGCVDAQLRVQLSWDTDFSDIDLHLIRPGGTVESDNDCFYANCTFGGLEWGAAGAAGNPVLDVDDTEGYGPENIIIPSGAEAGEYRVVVHNYDGYPNTRATVKIYLNEVEVQRFTSNPLDEGVRDYWQVARVNVNTGAVTAINTYSAAAPAAIVGGRAPKTKK
jgi:uncharacterized protein YfaP (DUF2135 family)